MKYRYEIVKSQSPHFPEGMIFDTDEKMHDGRKKETELADKDCKKFTVALRQSQ